MAKNNEARPLTERESGACNLTGNGLLLGPEVAERLPVRIFLSGRVALLYGKISPRYL